jgi:hypothetical protein
MVAKGQSERPKASRTKRKKPEAFVSKTGVEVKEAYCRKCMKMKNPSNFFTCVDNGFIDANGLMSICKDCISETYVKIFQSEHTIEKAILRTCRTFNIRFSEDALNAAIAHLKTQNKLPDDPSTFGIYKAKLLSTQKTGMINRDTTEDFTFVEVERSSVLDDPLDDSEVSHDLEAYWGSGKNYSDYSYLEERLAVWKRSYACQNASEEFYMKEVCHKELELQKARLEDRSVDPILKSMNDLLKNAALTPAQTNAASSGKGAESWGNFIRSIEESSPAEYFSDPEKELFKDYDNIGKYLWNYVTRPIKNFILNAKDYNILSEDDENEFEDSFSGGEIANGNESSPLE